MSSIVVRLSVVLVAGVLVAACASSGPTSNASDRSSPSGSTTSDTSSTAPFSPAFVGEGNVFFLSPSRNIGCALSETGVRCDVHEHTWSPPSPPASCHLDFGQGVTVIGTSPAMFTCAGDTVIIGDEVLAYRSQVTRGDFECRSDTAAMQCRNVKTGHRFSLSRENVTLS